MTAYDHALRHMYGLRRFGIKLGLETITRMLGQLGNPQNRFRCIHVAGTNGKGSIASALATILNRAGYRTGLFTSPHLVRFNERICIDGRPIDDGDVVAAYTALRDAGSGGREPTFFEMSTALALYEFGRRRVDWAVIETGMGGRLDATNVIQPEVSIISNISLEHKEYLGNTIAEISGEKAGIIKSGVPVVSGARQNAARAVIERVAAERKAPLFWFGKDFRVRRNRKKQMFDYYGVTGNWRGMQTGLKGEFQVENAAIVLAAAEQLMRRGTVLPSTAVRTGLKENRWPGRLEAIGRRPLILLDGAHNRMAARHLGHYMADALPGRPITLVVGILNDKPYRAILKDLTAHADRVVLTRPRIDRALEPDILLPVVKPLVARIDIRPTVADAVRHALETVGPEEAVVIAGSLYVVGEAKAFFETEDGKRYLVDG